MASARKKGLGKGLGALIGAEPLNLDAHRAAAPAGPGVAGARLLGLDPRMIEPNSEQPRQVFDEEKLEELAASIGRDGLLEPVCVREVDGKYELVSGERRVRASIMAGLEEIPAICREVSDREMLKLGLIENIQREDLNPMEIARGYQKLLDEFAWTQEHLSRELGKKRVTVTNTLRLLNLPKSIQTQVAEGELTMGHAKALLSLPSAQAQLAAARSITTQGLSVRQAEKLANGAKAAAAAKKAPAAKDPNIASIEDRLRRKLGAKVTLKSPDGKRGKIEIEYYSLDELERLLDLLG